MFCFPHAGGGASMFSPWARQAPPSLEILGLQLPGRESRHAEPPLRSLAALVQASSDAIVRQADSGIVLFGHSFGGMVAFLVARELRARGRPIRGLVVSAATPPQLLATRAPIHHLPDEAFLRVLADRYGGIPQAVLEDAELLAMCLPALRADLELLETAPHDGHVPIDLPIIALCGRDDVLATPGVMQRWSELTLAGFELREFEGGHFFVRSHAAEILREFQSFAGDAVFDNAGGSL